MRNQNDPTEPERTASLLAGENYALVMMLFDWESRQGLRLSCQKEYGWKVLAVMLQRDQRSS
jgi:hypothetical protein